jgi:hypothetical protein
MAAHVAEVLRRAFGVLMLGLVGLGPLRASNGPESVGVPDRRPFEGLKALVVEPENFWGSDAVVFGALEERGFDVTYAKAEALEDFGFLAQFDLVASNIKRVFTPKQVESLKRFVAEGGALYGSWGGPMFTPDLLNVCHVASTRSVRITGMNLTESPLSKGIAEKYLAFPPGIGHMHNGSWEIVSVEPLAGGIPVAKDSSGRTLGVLGRFGKGRTAVLGFAPDNEKYFVRREVGPVIDGQPAALVARRPDKSRTAAVDGGSGSELACSGGNRGGLSEWQAAGEARNKRRGLPQEGDGGRE